jgi:hypothetical protein
MTSPLTKKLIEAGIIRKHAVQLLERWGTLPHGTSEDALEDDQAEPVLKTEESLTAFTDEIDKILADAEKGKPDVDLDKI